MDESKTDARESYSAANTNRLKADISQMKLALISITRENNALSEKKQRLASDLAYLRSYYPETPPRPIVLERAELYLYELEANERNLVRAMDDLVLNPQRERSTEEKNLLDEIADLQRYRYEYEQCAVERVQQYDEELEILYMLILQHRDAYAPFER